ncbi:MAG: hypothetical protein J0M15_07610 [Deltaproteobacteria bacterium]|nr:hypothetical protein [Deltaproteobacteria bacterium]
MKTDPKKIKKSKEKNSKKEAPKLMKKMNSLKTSKKKATPKSLSPILDSKKLVATQGMFFHLEKELKLEIKSTEKRLSSKFHKIDARFASIDARFNKMEARFSDIDARFNKMEARFSEIDARFNKMEARFSEIDARFNTIESKLDKVLAEVHRMAVLMEEQNARNRFVLEGYDQLYKRQDRLEIEVERRLKNIEELIIKKKEF